jgi:hypothetical protein
MLSCFGEGTQCWLWGWVLLEVGLSFWVCCNFGHLLKVSIWDLGNLMNQHLCFEKPRHIRGIWWKVKPYMTKHNMKDLRYSPQISHHSHIFLKMCFFHLSHLLCQMFLKVVVPHNSHGSTCLNIVTFHLRGSKLYGYKGFRVQVEDLRWKLPWIHPSHLSYTDTYFHLTLPR